MRVNIVMLGVGSVERSLPFYRDQLGMTVANQFPGFAFVDGGGVTIGLAEPVARASEHVVGATELVLGVDNVRSAYKDLRARGVSFMNEPRCVDGTNWAANFADPDGHRLSIYGPEGQA